MTPIAKSGFGPLIISMLAAAFAVVAHAQTAAPANAMVYFINVKDGDTVKSHF
jgi:hypothetical protein